MDKALIEINYQEDLMKEAARIGLDPDQFRRNFFKCLPKAESDFKAAFFSPEELLDSDYDADECWEFLVSIRSKLRRRSHVCAVAFVNSCYFSAHKS